MQEINGCIETVLVRHFKLQLWHNHIKRLRKSLLHLNKSRLNAQELEQQILVYMNSVPDMNYVLRIEYDKRMRNFEISHRSLPDQNKVPVVDIIPSLNKPIHTLSWMKSNNRYIYSKALDAIRDLNLDDGIILNDQGRICESTISNIFIKNKNKYATPSLDEGCIDGIYRKKFIQECKRKGMEVEERPIDPIELHQAEHVFFTNAVRRAYPVQIRKSQQLF